MSRACTRPTQLGGGDIFRRKNPTDLDAGALSCQSVVHTAMAPNEPVVFKKKEEPSANDLGTRVAPTHKIAYTKKEFNDWYGGLDEWHAAPEKDKPDKLRELVVKGKREQAHDFLITRGVRNEEDRERIMNKHVPEKAPKRKPATELKPDVERYPAAAAAIAAGQVAFVTVSDSNLTAFTANSVRSLDRWTDGEIKLVGESLPLTVYATDAAASARLSSSSPAPLGKDGTARVVLLDGAEDLLDEAKSLGPEEARQWLKLAVVSTPNASHSALTPSAHSLPNALTKPPATTTLHCGYAAGTSLSGDTRVRRVCGLRHYI